MKILTLPIYTALPFLIGSAHAALVIDSFSGSTSGAASASGPTAAFFGFSPFPDREAAFTFTTGNGDTYLDQLQISVTIGDNSSPLSASLSTGPSAPGGNNVVQLGTFSATPTPTIQVATFTQTPSTILLTANTEYWVHLTVPTGGGIYTMTFSDTPSYANGFSLGDTWAYTPTSGLPPTGWNQDGTSGVARIRLNVTNVPEPTVALLSGLGVLALLRRRR